MGSCVTEMWTIEGGYLCVEYSSGKNNCIQALYGGTHRRVCGGTHRRVRGDTHRRVRGDTHRRVRGGPHLIWHP